MSARDRLEIQARGRTRYPEAAGGIKSSPGLFGRDFDDELAAAKRPEGNPKTFDRMLRAAFDEGVRLGVNYPSVAAIPPDSADQRFEEWKWGLLP